MSATQQQRDLALLTRARKRATNARDRLRAVERSLYPCVSAREPALHEGLCVLGGAELPPAMIHRACAGDPVRVLAALDSLDSYAQACAGEEERIKAESARIAAEGASADRALDERYGVEQAMAALGGTPRESVARGR